jgi:glutamine cyclotransferase
MIVDDLLGIDLIMFRNLMKARTIWSQTAAAPATRRVAVFCVLLAVSAQVSGQAARARSATPAKATATAIRTSDAPQLAYKVVNSYPHDPTAFLQGLVWHDGVFYESTGLHGQSTLRRVRLNSGKVTKSISLAEDLFGEGLALVENQLIQLTWQSHRGFVYDRKTFALIREFTYDTEGWGLTYDGADLILSDGTSILTYLDPQSFAPVRKLTVTWDGQPVVNINELEFIEGEIWANVWQTDFIIRIDPSTGQVNSFLDLKGILLADAPRGSDAVLNGIAYDAQNKRVFVSGKRWPRVFEIKIKKKVR